MFVAYGYLIFKFQDVYTLTKNIVIDKIPAITDNFVGDNVSIFILIIGIVFLLVDIAIYYLMNEKGKPTRYYKLMMGYSLLLIVYYAIYRYYVGLIVEFEIPSINALVIYRDGALLMYILNYIPVVFSFIRGFGFDIKKFSFEKDLEFETNREDSEEVEVNINVDKRKIVNHARKSLREMSYFYEEYQKIIKAVAFLIIAFLLGRIILSITYINKVYSQNEVFKFSDGLSGYITDTYVTPYDMANNIISKDHSFIISRIHFDIGSGDYLLNQYGLRFTFDDEEYYYHEFYIGEKFADLGKLYEYKILGNNRSYDFILVFKVKNESLKKKGYIELDKGPYGKYDSFFKIKVKIQDIEKKVVDNPDTINMFGGMKINSYELGNQFKENVETCIENKCTSQVKIIRNTVLGKKVMKLYLDYDMYNKELEYLNQYATFEYVYANKKMTVKNDVTLVIDKYEKYIYFNVDSHLEEADSVKFIIEDRFNKYIVNLTKAGDNSE